MAVTSKRIARKAAVLMKKSKSKSVRQVAASDLRQKEKKSTKKK